ncbi:MAG: hypothetical protein J2P18_18070 [Nocardia sp.]|nr:hypothetical protein [Nocardia sp.]
MPKKTRAAAIAAGAIGAVTAIASAPANAQTVQFPQTSSLFYGGLVCSGNIRTWADTSPQAHGRAVFNVQATGVQGVGPGAYPFAPLCNVDTTVAWHNVNTNASGQYRVNVVSGIYGSILYANSQNTGPGHIEVTVTTNNASAPSHGAFDVP